MILVLLKNRQLRTETSNRRNMLKSRDLCLKSERCTRAVNREHRVLQQKKREQSLEDWILVFLEVSATVELKVSIYYLSSCVYDYYNKYL